MKFTALKASKLAVLTALASSALGDVFDTINTYPLATDSVVLGHEFNYASDNNVNRLFQGNKQWVQQVKSQDPNFFQKFARGEDPKIMWIGCSDSREAVESITGTKPGEVFVHRNFGNIFFEDDLNLLSALDYAINHLEVNHIVITAHTHCNAIKYALDRNPVSDLIDNWLRRPQSVYTDFRNSVDRLDKTFGEGVISIFNAHQSLHHLVRTSLIQKAWKRGRKIAVHAWLFDMDTGYLHDTKFSVAGPQDLDPRARWNV
ncbi:hypothetical protein H4219_002190 [Mycoemilia scoparia]|uniref:Carbonic anhydrase n=1 Tax=Mycoemilia scoparia TaxID=417184 RepID=A0A9W8A7M4_9FUNG|nr:hypothetical protein H4219_002190 [Mycoemilia scoparia]